MNTIQHRPLSPAKLLSLALPGFILLLLSGCQLPGARGNGTITTSRRPVPDFTRVEADGAFELQWAKGAPALSITADENLIESIQAKVTGGRLRIGWVKPLVGTERIKIKTASAALKGAKVDGAVSLAASDLSGTEFYLDADGATRTVLKGKVNSLTAKMKGASDLDAGLLDTRATQLAIAQAGRAHVNVNEVLKAKISGTGTVTYKGNPRVSKEISSAGSMKKHDRRASNATNKR